MHIYKNPEELADQVSDLLMNTIAGSAVSGFHLAVSGGSTPNQFFTALASKYAGSALWQKTHFWWVDERMVSSNDPESNFGTAKKLLFSKIDIPEQNIHPIRGVENPQQESESYSRQIEKELQIKDGWPLFNMILLGMGDDGHTASIFPDHMQLLLSDRICEVAHHPLTNQARITLTGRVINNATKVWFLITGAGKAERLTEINSGTEKSMLFPTACIHPVHGELSWFLDEPAASRLL